MPCGQFDKRRGGHRCVACRRAHARCDGVAGRQPCSYCQVRLLTCSYSPRRPSALQLVLVKASSPPPSKAIVVDSWKYTTACFEKGLGTLQLFSVMRSEGMVALSQTSPDVSETISLLGEMFMYVCGGGGGGGEFMKQRKRLERVAARRKTVCDRQFRDCTTWAVAPLACRLIMVLIDSILYPEQDPISSWMRDATDFINRTLRGRELSSFEEDLIRIYQFSDGANAISRLVLPSCPDYTAGILDCQHPPATSSQLRTAAPVLLNGEVDYILSAMWHWAVLQIRMIAWVDIDDPTDNTGAYVTLEQKIEGIEIVCAVGALQAKILQRYMDLTSAADGSDSGSETHQLLLRVAPFTHWILVGISQQLQHEKWKILRCDLPAMTLDGLRRHALAGLDCMDAMVDPAGLCVISLLPLVFSMGFEMVSEQERGHVLGLLNTEQSRQFGASMHFQNVLTRVWASEL